MKWPWQKGPNHDFFGSAVVASLGLPDKALAAAGVSARKAGLSAVALAKADRS
jgi:hypothetical protein